MIKYIIFIIYKFNTYSLFPRPFKLSVSCTKTHPSMQNISFLHPYPHLNASTLSIIWTSLRWGDFGENNFTRNMLWTFKEHIPHWIICQFPKSFQVGAGDCMWYTWCIMLSSNTWLWCIRVRLLLFTVICVATMLMEIHSCLLHILYIRAGQLNFLFISVNLNWTGPNNTQQVVLEFES